jgi:2-alkenal reductase
MEEGWRGGAWLGITGVSMSPVIAEAMDLSSDQSGVLIQQVHENSPADLAGLRGSSNSITINGEQVLIGGDVVISLDEHNIGNMLDLHHAVEEYSPGEKVRLTILRDGELLDVDVILSAIP